MVDSELLVIYADYLVAKKRSVRAQYIARIVHADHDDNQYITIIIYTIIIIIYCKEYADHNDNQYIIIIIFTIIIIISYLLFVTDTTDISV